MTFEQSKLWLAEIAAVRELVAKCSAGPWTMHWYHDIPRREQVQGLRRYFASGRPGAELFIRTEDHNPAAPDGKGRCACIAAEGEFTQHNLTLMAGAREWLPAWADRLEQAIVAIDGLQCTGEAVLAAVYMESEEVGARVYANAQAILAREIDAMQEKREEAESDEQH